MQKIILASQSPRRRELLHLAEIDFEVIVADTDESFPEGLSFEEAAVFIAKNKALAVAAKIDTDKIILAADTIVVCNNKIIGKPVDRSHAIEIITALSGNKHEVITGVYMFRDSKEISFADTTSVTFHTLTQEQIVYYVDKYKPYDKAGAYAIQEWIGAVGIKNISGDFYNVMGLPISRVVVSLNDFFTVENEFI
ncbi:MAG: Maf family protein [Ferruginibacter sp.]|nr:Maf family protein [Ferruginibacter sp.]